MTSDAVPSRRGGHFEFKPQTREEEKEKSMHMLIAARRDGNVYKTYTSISIGVSLSPFSSLF